MPKTVFVAHPIAGDVEGNVKKVLTICRAIHTKDVIPIAPYIVSLQYLDDGVHEDRQLGIDANRVCFERKLIDEVWLFGDRISSGMKHEVILAITLGIPVYAKTPETKRALYLLLKQNYALASAYRKIMQQK